MSISPRGTHLVADTTDPYFIASQRPHQDWIGSCGTYCRGRDSLGTVPCGQAQVLILSAGAAHGYNRSLRCP